MAFLFVYIFFSSISTYYLFTRGSVLRDGAAQLLVVLFSIYIVGGLILCNISRIYYVDSYLSLDSGDAMLVFEQGLLSLSGMMISAVLLRTRNYSFKSVQNKPQPKISRSCFAKLNLTSFYSTHTNPPVLLCLIILLSYLLWNFYSTDTFFYSDWSKASRLSASESPYQNIISFLLYEVPAFLIGILTGWQYLCSYYTIESTHCFVFPKARKYLPLLLVCCLCAVRGDRTTLLISAMPLLLSIAYQSRNKYVLFLVGISLPLMSAVLSALRTFAPFLVLNNQFSIQEVASSLQHSIFESSETASSLNLIFANNLIQSNGYFYGDVLYSTIIGAMPRFLAENLSTSFRSSAELLSEKMFPNLVSEGGGVGAFYSLDGYLDFGFIGTFAYSLIFSYILFRIYSASSVNTLLGFCSKACIITFYCTYSIRSGQLISIKMALLYGLFAIFYLILYRSLSTAFMYVASKKIS